MKNTDATQTITDSLCACIESARAEGWVGADSDYEHTAEDLDSVVDDLGRKPTAEEWESAGLTVGDSHTADTVTAVETVRRLSHPLAGLYPYVLAPADYDVDALTHEDAQHDSEVQCFARVDDLVDLVHDFSEGDIPEMTRAEADAYLENAVCGGALALDEATHADLVDWLAHD